MSATPAMDTLHVQFAAQVRASPDALAAIDAASGEELSYRRLWNRTVDLARTMQDDYGVGRDDKVGIFLPKSNAFLAAHLAAMVAGGAYLPFELDYPPSVLAEMIAHAGAKAIATTTDLAARLPGGGEGLPLILVDAVVFSNDADDAPLQDAPDAHNDLDALAFVCYSSGTTGKPKSILNPHRAPVVSYAWRFTLNDYGVGHRVAANVFYIWEAIRPLLKGGCLVSVPNDMMYDPRVLIETYERLGVTETLMTASLAETVLNNVDAAEVGRRLAKMKIFWFNGEVVTRSLLARFTAALPNVRAFNLYSISECHEVTAVELSDASLWDAESCPKFCPAGLKTDFCTIYLLDEDRNPVPEGEAGELWVGGPTLARGYGDPQLTAARFPPCPWADPSEPDQRMYKTGDKAVILPDGNVVILGRVDFFVKVRGYSIALGAVEHAVLDRLAVKSTVVIAEGAEGEDKRLVGYLVRADEADVAGRHVWDDIDPVSGASHSIHTVLHEALAAYLIPAIWIEIPELPINAASGKLNRKALPSPPARASASWSTSDGGVSGSGGGGGGGGGSRSVVARLAVVWSEVVGAPAAALNSGSNFFEVGGHSLAAARVMSRVEAEFGVRLTVADLFADPTIGGLASLLRAAGVSDGDVSSDGDEFLPISERMAATIETHDSAGLVFNESSSGPAVLDRNACVLLTGITGFFGLHLAVAMLDVTTEGTVIAVVRGTSYAEAKSRLLAHATRYRVEMAIEDALAFGTLELRVVDSLASPSMGLAADVVAELSLRVTMVVHAAAEVNLVRPFDSLVDSNVVSTAELISFCASSTPAKPLHYVSTDSVLVGPPGTTFGEADDLSPEHLANGYSQTKYVAEVLVRRAGERGLPVAIYRPGNLGADTASGVANPNDYLTLVFTACLHVGAYPSDGEWKVELTAVDYAARGLVFVASGGGAYARKYFNMTLNAADRPSGADVIGHLSAATGLAVEGVPFDAWIERVRAWAPRSEHLRKAKTMASSFASLEALSEPTDYSATNWGTALSVASFERPAVDAGLLGLYAHRMALPRTPGPADKPRVAVVTGASSGIGKAIARALAAEGISVALGARRLGKLQEVATAIEADFGVRCVAVATDVTSRVDVRDLVTAAEDQLGPVDVLVNNAGVMYFTAMSAMRQAEWETTVDVHCKGTLHGVGAVLDSMLARGTGHIVNISSDAGRKVFPGLAVYSAAKFFVEALSQGLRLENAGTGLRVTTIQPGNVASELLTHAIDSQGMADFGEPSGAKILEPDDVARAVVYVVTQPEWVAVNEILVEPREEPA